MTHLFMCREYPPAAYPPGGIGTYVRHITDLLARADETVHVIAHRWDGAPLRREELLGGRLVLHRVALDEALLDTGVSAPPQPDARVPRGLLASRFPAQTFSWQAALVAESLIAREGVDIVEAQEWEAPLYYLQLRRALGLGPRSLPPCVVHIHSPTERIFAANAWDTTVADYDAAAGLEAYSITAADAVLCPSRFVANEVMARYGVDPAIVSVVPYPRGDVPVVARDAHTWAAGSICHVGRLELRKGVLEWADAIALVASEHPQTTFDFVGGDMPVQVTGGSSVGRALLARLPRRVRGQVRFHGTQDRRGVLDVLATACASVVPSRWENFPYSCIEAMSTGLPVIASPHGGMREMIEDGVSGWLAPDGTGAGLALALRRALAQSGGERQQMGTAAAERIRQVCDNDTIVARHLALKSRLVEAGARRPSAAPPAGSAAAPGDDGAHRGEAAVSGARTGLAVIVTGVPGPAGLERCLAGLRAQTVAPVAVRVVCDDNGARLDAGGSEPLLRLVQTGGRTVAAAAMGAAEELTATCRTLQGVVFVEARAQLAPACFATCAALLHHDPRLGLVSGWTADDAPGAPIHVPPNPTRPHVWHGGAVAPCVVVRVEALAGMRGASLLEALAGAGTGWSAVTYPGVLSAVAPGSDDALIRRDALRYSSMAGAVQRLHTPILQWLRTCSPADRRAFVAQGMRSPGQSLRWLAARVFGARGVATAPPAEPLMSSHDRAEDRPDAKRRVH